MTIEHKHRVDFLSDRSDIMIYALYYFEVLLPESHFLDGENFNIAEAIQVIYKLIGVYGFLMLETGSDEQNEIALNFVERHIENLEDIDDIVNLEETERFYAFLDKHC